MPKKVCDEAIVPVLGDKTYKAKDAQKWSADIVESVLSKLKSGSSNYKYVVTCLVLENNGAGLHTSSSCFWDQDRDGSCSVSWNNATMHSIVTVFGLSQ